jgi:hypothetical protein
VHIHLNDTSDEAAVDVSYVTAEEDLILLDKGDFTNQKFEKDAAGVVMRYKILVHDQKVKAVLYNTGKSIERVNFKEMRLEKPGDNVTQYVNVKHLTRRKFARIHKIPLAMLASPSKDKLEYLAQG